MNLAEAACDELLSWAARSSGCAWWARRRSQVSCSSPWPSRTAPAGQVEAAVAARQASAPCEGYCTHAVQGVSKQDTSVLTCLHGNPCSNMHECVAQQAHRPARHRAVPVDALGKHAGIQLSAHTFLAAGAMGNFRKEGPERPPLPCCKQAVQHGSCKGVLHQLEPIIPADSPHSRA